MAEQMTEEQHKQRHIELHRALDELCADWITHTGKMPSEGTVMDLIKWSNTQTKTPTDKEH